MNTDNNNSVRNTNESNQAVKENTMFLTTDNIQFRINDSETSATIWIDKGHGEPKATAQFASFDKMREHNNRNNPVAAAMLKGLFGVFAGRKALGVGAVVNRYAVEGREEGRALDSCALAMGSYVSDFFDVGKGLDARTLYRIGWDSVYHATPVEDNGKKENSNAWAHYRSMQALRYNLNKGLKVTISWTPVRDENGEAIMRNGESLSLLGLAKKVAVAFDARGDKNATMKIYNEMNDKVEAQERIANTVLSSARGKDLATSETVKGYGDTEYLVSELVGSGEYIIYNRDTEVSRIVFTESNVKTVVAALLATFTMSIEAVS